MLALFSSKKSRVLEKRLALCRMNEAALRNELPGAWRLKKAKKPGSWRSRRSRR